jgi:hypothetical protein
MYTRICSLPTFCHPAALCGHRHWRHMYKPRPPEQRMYEIITMKSPIINVC